MADILVRIWQNLLERTEGPMHFRFLMQPLMSLIFAIKAAIRDAKQGDVPYLWRLVYAKKAERKPIAKETWKDVGKIFIIGVILDIIYQLIVVYKVKTEEHFYPLESIIVAFLLAIVPYIIFRGPVNRIITLFKGKQQPKKNDES